MNPFDATAPLPNDELAEKAVLAICFENPNTAFQVCKNCLTDDSFYNKEHAKIWRLLKAHSEAGKPFDLTSIFPGIVEAQIDGAEAIQTLSKSNAATEYFKFHLETVQNKASLRKIYAIAYETLSATIEHEAKAAEVIGQIKTGLQMCESTSADTTGRHIRDMWLDLIESMQTPESKAKPIPTGLTDIDEKTRGGPRRGQMVLLGALRHVGKTAFVRQVALNAASSGYKVLAFLAESSDTEEAANSMSVMSGHPTEKFRDSEHLEKGTKDAMMRVMAGKIPDLRIDTEPNISVDLIESRCRLLKATQGLDVLAIDYLQFFRTTGTKGQNREQMIAEDARRIKVLARELDIVIYLLAQLNDEIAPEDEPEIRHLRESKGPANHADVILLMNAPDGIAHNPKSPNEIQKRHLYNRKWRGVGAFSLPFPLKFKGSTQQFLNS